MKIYRVKKYTFSYKRVTIFVFSNKIWKNIIEIIFICKPMGVHHSSAWEDIWYNSHTQRLKASEKKIAVHQIKKDIASTVCDMLDVTREQQRPNSYKTKEQFFFHNIDSIISYLIRTRESDNSWEILRKWAEWYGISKGDINAIIIYKNTINKIKHSNAQEIFRENYFSIQKIKESQWISFDQACKQYWEGVGKKKYKDWNITKFDWLTASKIPFLLIMQIVKKYELGDESS